MIKPPVRAIHVVPAISNEASGPSYSVVRLCESLIAQGQAVTLAALDLAPMPSPASYSQNLSAGDRAAAARTVAGDETVARGASRIAVCRPDSQPQPVDDAQCLPRLGSA